MITAIKKLLRLILFPAVYIGGFFISIYTIFKDVRWGLFLLIALIPQANIYYKFHSMPFGKDFLDILFMSVIFGMMYQRLSIKKTSNTFIIVIFLIYTYMSLWNSAYRFNLPMPISGSSWQLMEWKNFAQMIFFYFIIVAVVKDEEDQKKIFGIMAVVLLFIAIRNYRNFSGGAAFRYDKRIGGPFEFVGLGATHYGAFVAHFMIAFLGMALFKIGKRFRMLLSATFVFCLHPLFFAYSRGAYLATLTAMTFYGVFKRPIILVGLTLVVLCWSFILPVSVVDRISGTETADGKLESSANTRLLLWDQASGIIESYPLFGVGWEGFGLIIPKDQEIHNLTDTHNYYIKTLCDRGIIGLLILLIILVKAFLSGLRLYRCGKNEFQKGLGFCFMGTMIACMVTNVFGDRFTYFIMGSYLWIMWGLVDSGIYMCEESKR